VGFKQIFFLSYTYVEDLTFFFSQVTPLYCVASILYRCVYLVTYIYIRYVIHLTAQYGLFIAALLYSPKEFVSSDPIMGHVYNNIVHVYLKNRNGILYSHTHTHTHTLCTPHHICRQSWWSPPHHSHPRLVLSTTICV